MASYLRPLLLTLALTATLGRTQATLPLCAESCSEVSAVIAGCDVCCTNTDFIQQVQSCVAIDCTTTEQQEATEYFDSTCDVSSSSGLTSGTATFASTASTASAGNSAAGTSAAKTSAALTAAKTTAGFTQTSVAPASTSSSKSIAGFNGSLGGFVTRSDVLKIVAVTIVGLTAMTQL
ncbi:hypothetical protein BT96DRAFT_919808 [Gymnopus androsaceus JB14]|uniref:CFEM domain-containing protein n=1 Tax=Gymnopus androsaceus JB14 TaxID=1447944 RepID=A0A6A4HSG9_9AGAR|nr:hypothetical protein BT96DRAFT_919808 [Gymnopus androsaceus JB14]